MKIDVDEIEQQIVALKLPDEALLTSTEAAAALRVKPQTVRGWVGVPGTLQPFSKVNGRNLYRVADIRRLLNGSNTPQEGT